MTDEAQLELRPTGHVATTDGWFVVNLRDAVWLTSEVMGGVGELESGAAAFTGLGIRVTTLLPGQSHGFYHRENAQEGFLVLAGECLLLVEGEERPLRSWDFFHSPPGTDHVLVGAGDGPCSILMVGERPADAQITYVVSELAQRHGAGLEQETHDPAEAYANADEERLERPAYWDDLPWARA